MQQTQNKILIGIDGSEQSLQSVRYISAIMPPEKTRIVLLHIERTTPESFKDFEKERTFQPQSLPIRQWAEAHHEWIMERMQKSVQILAEAGFPDDAVTVSFRDKKQGVARDILEESKEDYTAVVAGRTGNSRLKDIVIGSLTTKLIGRLQQIPLIVVGGSPSAGKVMIGFDGSEGSMKAVDYVASIFSGIGREIVLCHVVRYLSAYQRSEEFFLPEHQDQWFEISKNEIQPAFEEAGKRLVAAGFSPHQIDEKVITHSGSRSACLMEEAEKAGCGTIVVGRRGISAVEAFFMGRVSSKIIMMGNQMAVWVVG